MLREKFDLRGILNLNNHTGSDIFQNPDPTVSATLALRVNPAGQCLTLDIEERNREMEEKVKGKTGCRIRQGYILYIVKYCMPRNLVLTTVGEVENDWGRCKYTRIEL